MTLEETAAPAPASMSGVIPETLCMKRRRSMWGFWLLSIILILSFKVTHRTAGPSSHAIFFAGSEHANKAILRCLRSPHRQCGA